MKAIVSFSQVLAKAIKIRSKLFLIPALIYFSISAYQSVAQQPVVTVRFSNPEYVCATQTYSLDVEFQCNTANKELHGMNVRFYYDDEILEFTSFGEFVQGYGVTPPNPPYVETDTTENGGMEIFGIDGPWEYINGAIKKTSGMYTTILSTTGWTKLFNINFHVDDPESMKDPSFCPSAIWDMKENPADGGFSGNSGVVITLVVNYPNITENSTENVLQYNWQYDSVPGLPYGNPVENSCISTLSSYAPKTKLPFCGKSAPGPVSVPITVNDFNLIKSFSLVIRYYPTAITYVNSSANPIFNSQNGLLTIVEAAANSGMRKITLTFNGINTISLPGNSVLATLNFNYIAGETCLEWKTSTNGCVYYGPGNVLKCSDPYTDYFINGGVLSSLAPITKIDSAVAMTGDVATFNIRTWNFNNIRSGSLTLNYDPEVLTYSSAVPNAAIADSFTVDNSVPGSLLLSFFEADTSLPNGSGLMFVAFQYLGGSSPLTWFDNGSSCQYFHCNLQEPMMDAPQATYYYNGNISSSVSVWNGDNSTDWNANTNWPNNSLPDQFTNVTLDPNADPAYWPTFTGDFILGEDCKNLTLNGTATLTITGDLVINPGHTLNLGSGKIYVNGDWINSGTFIPGTGIVEFTGTNDVVIDEGVPPGNFVAAYVRSTFSAGYTPIAGGTSGPSGDNAHSDVNIGFNFGYLGTNYNQARINTNGWLSLNLTGDDATSSDNTILFNTATPGTTLAPWWDDLLADANTTISYITVGAAPNRIFTAEWKNILAFGSVSTTRLNFQVKLYETSNVIEFLYGSVSTGTHNTLESASIGIKDATGGAGHFIEAVQNSTNIILAILKSDSNWPAANYRFSPPVVPLMDTFYKIVVSKPSGKLSIGRDVMVTGIN
jgi:hypothetical protein